MHGAWIEEEDIFLVTLRLGTNFSWKKIEESFNDQFPSKTATAKDLESRYNKTLKPRLESEKRGVADIIDDYRHGMPIATEERPVVEAAVEILDKFPNDRLWGRREEEDQ